MGVDAFTDARRDSSKGSRKVRRLPKRIPLRMLGKILWDSCCGRVCVRLNGSDAREDSLGFLSRLRMSADASTDAR